MIQGISCGLLFRVNNSTKVAAVEASWPDVVEQRDGLRRKILITAESGKAHLEKMGGAADSSPAIRIYHPVAGNGSGEVELVVVMEMSDRDGTARRTVANLLRWNSEWLKYAIGNAPKTSSFDLSDTFGMALACLDQQEFRGSAMALVTVLAERFGAQRVSLGLHRHNCMEVQVLSHSARFKHETNLIQAIGAAMDEAADQDRIIVFPADGESSSGAITHAHSQLAREMPNGTVCTVPLCDRGEIIGALVLERDTGLPLNSAEILHIEKLAALIAPILSLKHKDEQNLPVKAWQSLKETGSSLFGPAHIKLKLAATVSMSLLLFFSVAQGDWRVTAEAVVEGRVQRTIAAPIDGYISSAEARAGDIVVAKQLMGALDDSDLRLQRLKWSTLRQQMVSESREAMAQHNRAEVGIVKAKIDQASAELKLIDEQLSRTQLLAPFDGIVIEGDLSQLLGTPVTRGDTLFKVAPLDDYRIVLNVNEQDIEPIEPGQTGKLILASMPQRQLELRVEKVTPVSTAGQGQNYFRVEASLVGDELKLQPGMEGIGKVEVGEANLFWIWTRGLGNWLRLQTWTWLR